MRARLQGEDDKTTWTLLKAKQLLLGSLQNIDPDYKYFRHRDKT